MLQLKTVQCSLHHVTSSGLEDDFSSCRMGFLKYSKFSGVIFQQNSDFVHVMLVRGKTPDFLLS